MVNISFYDWCGGNFDIKCRLLTASAAAVLAAGDATHNIVSKMRVIA